MLHKRSQALQMGQAEGQVQNTDYNLWNLVFSGSSSNNPQHPQLRARSTTSTFGHGGISALIRLTHNNNAIRFEPPHPPFLSSDIFLMKSIPQIDTWTRMGIQSATLLRQEKQWRPWTNGVLSTHSALNNPNPADRPHESSGLWKTPSPHVDCLFHLTEGN